MNKYVVATLVALTMFSAPAALSWEQIPAKSQVPDADHGPKNKCAVVKDIVKSLKANTMALAMSKWVPLAMMSVQAQKAGNYNFNHLLKSDIIPMNIRHYKTVSTETTLFCSANLTINGKPLVLTGEQGRNHLRFIVQNGEPRMIDYDTNIFDYRNYPIVKQEKA